ncbi:hypothetical protein BC828DRAFT_183145 [Blastocladiella britannica]|nr:hypothetical protein BC828DRAFT_183145 [Blastocladiella britannica]
MSTELACTIQAEDSQYLDQSIFQDRWEIGGSPVTDDPHNLHVMQCDRNVFDLWMVVFDRSWSHWLLKDRYKRASPFPNFCYVANKSQMIASVGSDLPFPLICGEYEYKRDQPTDCVIHFVLSFRLDLTQLYVLQFNHRRSAISERRSRPRLIWNP